MHVYGQMARGRASPVRRALFRHRVSVLAALAMPVVRRRPRGDKVRWLDD